MGVYGQQGTPDTGSPPACRVFNSAALSMTHNVFTVVTFDSERFDTDSMHSVSTNTNRITFNTPGVFLVSFMGALATATDYTVAVCGLRLNGATLIAIGGCGTFTQSDSEVPISVSTPYKFAANDWVEVIVKQKNGASAARSLNASLNYSPEFAAMWMGLGT